jgi:hypothetical protein
MLGYYYDNSLNKTKGLIRFDIDEINYKTTEEAKKTRIKPEQLNAFKIGIDSFLVVSNRSIKNKIKTEPVFAQYITEFGSYKFVKTYEFRDIVVGNQNPIRETFFFKHANNPNWEEIPTSKKRLSTENPSFFSYYPSVTKMLNLDSYEDVNVLSLIKNTEYFYKFKHSIPIYFNEFWQEINEPEAAIYHALICQFNDSVCTIDYFKESIKLYTINYASVHPNIKEGEFIFYHPDGSKRQLINYENDKPKELYFYDKANKLTIQYDYVDRYDATYGITYGDQVYISIIDSSGNNLILNKEGFDLTIYDEFNKQIQHQKFKNYKLHSSCFNADNLEIYQTTNYINDIKINKLQNKLDSYLKKKDINLVLATNIQGMLLLKLVIDTKGTVINGSLLTKLHPDIDSQINDFINEVLVNKDASFRFSSFKSEKEKKHAELIIPVEVVFERIFRNSYMYYNPMHFNQPMINNLYPIHNVKF